MKLINQLIRTQIYASNAIYENKKRMVGRGLGERGSKQLRRRHRMESIPGNFNVHLAPIEAPGCTTTSAASRTVSLDCQVQASIHRFNDKLLGAA